MGASHCGDFSCCRAQTRGRAGFSSCSHQALELRLSSCGTASVAPQQVGSSPIRDELVFTALAGRFFTTEPSGKPSHFLKLLNVFKTMTTWKNFTLCWVKETKQLTPLTWNSRPGKQIKGYRNQSSDHPCGGVHVDWVGVKETFCPLSRSGWWWLGCVMSKFIKLRTLFYVFILYKLTSTYNVKTTVFKYLVLYVIIMWILHHLKSLHTWVSFLKF